MSKERELLKRVKAEGYISFGLYKEIEELLAQPEQEQEPVAWCQLVEGKVQDLLTSFEMKDWLYDKSWIPLYTAPPKREPFGPEERQRLSRAYSTQAEQVAFEEGIIFAEISYGIGGE